MRYLAMILFVVLFVPASVVADDDSEPTSEQRVRGLLVGSLLGDAVGGPVEFKDPATLGEWVPDMRKWSPDEFRDEMDSGKLAARLKLIPYHGIRPDIAPYGPWEKEAEPGTVTDDSRHKMILMHCLRKLDSQPSVTAKDLCQAYLDFAKQPAIAKRDDYVALAKESFREYNSAARWILGDRDLDTAFPPQRLWVGIGTCSGQMTLLPLACAYPGDADSAYRAAYAIDFVDVGSAKDINAALVAGLAAALGSTESDRDARWRAVLQAIRETDPYRYADVPFAKRPATEWLEFALNAAKRADDSPAKLFSILEKEGTSEVLLGRALHLRLRVCILKFLRFPAARGARDQLGVWARYRLGSSSHRGTRRRRSRRRFSA